LAILNLKDNDGFLLKNQTSDITTADFYVGDGGAKAIHVFGTFGGGTVSIEGTKTGLAADASPLTDSTGSTINFSVPSIQSIDRYPIGVVYRAKLTGSTAPDISVKLV